MKLGEIEATKGKGGDYYGIDEILGEEIEIIEAITADSDIREYKTKPKPPKESNLYYCIKIRHAEEKDLHLTKAALLAVAAALPKTEAWTGYKLRINRTGSGFSTAYKVVVAGKGISGYTPPAVSQADRIKSVLDDIKLYCKLDHIIPEEKLKKLCGDDATFKYLKDAGFIIMATWDKQEGWKATQ